MPIIMTAFVNYAEFKQLTELVSYAHALSPVEKS